MFKYLLELKANKNKSSLNIFVLNYVLFKWKLWLRLLSYVKYGALELKHSEFHWIA